MSISERDSHLIVGGDDFGLSAEANEAIILAHRNGALTSCSLMVTGAAFDEAVRLAKENPLLAVGIHLVAVCGRAALPHDEVPFITDRSGCFSSSPVRAGLKYFFHPRARRELRKEIRAQFDKFSLTGIRLSHIDGHLHMHIHPVVYAAALECGEAYGTRRIRIPIEDAGPAIRFDPRHAFRKRFLAALFALLGRHAVRKARPRNFVSPDRVYGFLQTGRMNEEYFLYTLQHLPAGTSEIYFHPAVYPLTANPRPEQRQCLDEYQALTSSRVKQRLSQRGISAVNYFALEEARTDLPSLHDLEEREA